ncbi:MAG: hypothetical protein ACI4OS_01860, partial [Akkermansia sp.]
MRTRAFKRWFGDWEKVQTFRFGIEKLKVMDPVANITGNEFAPTGKNDLVQRVVDYWEQYGNTAHNPILGDVKLDKSSARASIAHGIGRIKAAAFSAVKEVIENGVFIEHAPNWKGRGDDSYVFAAPISINGEDYVCEVILMKNKARTGFYLHEVQVKEKLLDVFKTGVVTSTSGAPKSILLQVMGRVKDIDKKCSKILDENGEPLVVYHGSRSAERLRVLDPAQGQNAHAIWFSDMPEVAAHWSGTSKAVRFDDSLAEKIDALRSLEAVADFAERELGEDDFRRMIMRPMFAAENPWGQKQASPERKLERAKDELKYRLQLRELAPGRTYYAFVALRNPLVVDAKGSAYHSIDFEQAQGKRVNTEFLATYAREHGHDGVMVRDVRETDDE